MAKESTVIVLNKRARYQLNQVRSFSDCRNYANRTIHTTLQARLARRKGGIAVPLLPPKQDPDWMWALVDGQDRNRVAFVAERRIGTCVVEHSLIGTIRIGLPSLLTQNQDLCS